MEKATLGAGCFWCVEAVFQHLKGVQEVVSGYSGGNVENPGYEQVCTGKTGHAEVVQISFDPQVISYDELLDVFFLTHDPTQKNKQGNDVGPQYRSVLFYHDINQKKIAEDKISELTNNGVFSKPIVTEISPFEKFYPAEGYHQDFYISNPDKPYCAVVIQPKLDKLKKEYSEKMNS